jgi:hypothetical protein
MERGLIRVTGLYLRGRRCVAGLQKKYAPNYKVLLYIDLRDFVTDDPAVSRTLLNHNDNVT